MDNKDFEKNSIDDILKEFQAKRDSREKSDYVPVNVEPPKPRADFAKAERKQPKPDKEVNKPKIELKKIDFSPLKSDKAKGVYKYLIIIVLIIAVFFAAVFGIGNMIKSSKTSYIKKYEKKYTDVSFPDGIEEKYCELYGKNPNTCGYLKIDDIDLSSPVLKKADGKGTPYLEKSAKGARVDNFVVYLNDDSLEKYYSSVDSYNNSASGFISFSDLKTDYNFKVIGAFYTNTKASDDNGYVFPYNVTEQMEPSSALEFYTMLHYRFLYDTGASPIRSDKLITISCPTSYHKDFRFVVVGVARDDDKKFTASPKKLIRYPQVICDEKGSRNHFASAKPWYPQIVITSEKDNTTTTKIIDTK